MIFLTVFAVGISASEIDFKIMNLSQIIIIIILNRVFFFLFKQYWSTVDSHDCQQFHNHPIEYTVKYVYSFRWPRPYFMLKRLFFSDPKKYFLN